MRGNLFFFFSYEFRLTSLGWLRVTCGVIVEYSQSIYCNPSSSIFVFLSRLFFHRIARGSVDLWGTHALTFYNCGSHCGILSRGNLNLKCDKILAFECPISTSNRTAFLITINFINSFVAISTRKNFILLLTEENEKHFRNMTRRENSKCMHTIKRALTNFFERIDLHSP